MKKSFIMIFLLLTSSVASAHFIWLEKSTANTANVYFGEWHKDLFEKKEKLKRFATTKVFLSDDSKFVTLQLKEEYLQANIKTDSDVRMLQSSLPARKSKRDGSFRKTFYYGKSGRQETTPVMNFEIVPINSGGNQFIVWFNGKPLERAEVSVYGPPKWKQDLRSDKEGKITIETPWEGNYLIKSSHKIESKSDQSSMSDPAIRHLFTGTIHVSNGIQWGE